MTPSRCSPALVPGLHRAPVVAFSIRGAMVLLGTALFATFAGCFNQSGTGPVDIDAPAPCQDGEVPHGTVVDDSQSDCIVSTCQDGELLDEPDDSEIPDDGLECTADSCENGQKRFQPMPGASCGQGGVLMCNPLGQCEGCTAASECGVDSQCRIWECHADHTCGAMDFPQGTPLSNQTPGDCQRDQCNGVGGEEAVEDPSDVLDDGNECTDDVCDKTMPASTNSPKDTACSNGYCDGNGACVECNDPTQCGMATFCQARTCTGGTCGVSNTMDGTPLMNQTAGDCKEAQCDGNGGTKTVNNDTDRPVDGNDCTDDVCLAGVPSNPNKSLGAMCNQGGGTACDGLGTCKKANGATCSGGSVCATGNCIDGVCCDQPCTGRCYSCNQTNNAGKCLLLPAGQEDPNSTPPCTVTSACTSQGFCLLKNGQSCMMANACINGNCVDGVCCESACTDICKSCNVTNSAGLCTNILVNGEDNYPAGTCVMTKACNGSGSCLGKTGAPCTTGSQCLSNMCLGNMTCQ